MAQSLYQGLMAETQADSAIPKPTVTGLLETALYVESLERSARFYKHLFGFERMAGDRRFCALNIANQQVLLLFQRGESQRPSPIPGGTIPGHDGCGRQHLALAITLDLLLPWEHHLAAAGIPIESQVSWPNGGISLYFRDPDQHSIELATPGVWSIY